MENKKNTLGNIYGTRLSRNGKWLNLIITAEVNGEKVFITCPVRLEDDFKHPYACEEAFDGKMAIHNLPLYADKKPQEAGDGEIPF